MPHNRKTSLSHLTAVANCQIYKDIQPCNSILAFQTVSVCWCKDFFTFCFLPFRHGAPLWGVFRILRALMKSFESCRNISFCLSSSLLYKPASFPFLKHRLPFGVLLETLEMRYCQGDSLSTEQSLFSLRGLITNLLIASKTIPRSSNHKWRTCVLLFSSGGCRTNPIYSLEESLVCTCFHSLAF